MQARSASTWCANPTDRSFCRHRLPLGGPAFLRLDQPEPTSGERFRGVYSLRRSLPLRRLQHGPATKARTSNNRFEMDSQRRTPSCPSTTSNQSCFGRQGFPPLYEFVQFPELSLREYPGSRGYIVAGDLPRLQSGSKCFILSSRQRPIEKLAVACCDSCRWLAGVDPCPVSTGGNETVRDEMVKPDREISSSRVWGRLAPAGFQGQRPCPTPPSPGASRGESGRRCGARSRGRCRGPVRGRSGRRP